MADRPSRTPTPAQRAAERTGRSQRNLYEFLRIYKWVSDQYGAPDRDVLDYGCGSGYGTRLLAEHFGQARGVDVYPATIEDCRAAYSSPNLSFDVLDPARQPYPDESFDVITSFQVVEHVPASQIDDYFNNIYRMLKPGGVALITTPNAANYFGGHSGNPHHVREYRPAEFHDLVSQHWPSKQWRLMAQRDVLSTSIGIRLRRRLRGHRLAWPIAGVLVQPIRALERVRATDQPGGRLFATDRLDKVIGGLCAELRKPLT